MDGVLPFTAGAPPAAPPAAGAATTGEAAGEGGFAGALTRSMGPPPAQAASASPDAPPIMRDALPPASSGATALLASGLPEPQGTALAAPAGAGGVVTPPSVSSPAMTGPITSAGADAAGAGPAVTPLAGPEPAAPELAGPGAALAQAQAVPQPKPAMADTLATPPDTELPPKAPLPPSSIASVRLEPKALIEEMPIEEAPIEEEELESVEANPLLAPMAAPPLAPGVVPASLSASAPSARAGAATEAPPTQDPIATAPSPDNEPDAPLPEATLPASPLQEPPPSALPERSPPPNLTTALWQAEALAPLSGFDPSAAALRPAEIASHAPAGAAAPPLPAARQVASVAVALAFAPNGTGGFNLSLEPAELGRVEIRVRREGDTHSVRVTAERPETLALLQRDRHELDRNLADAGLRIDAGGIAFSLEGQAADGGAGQREGQREDQRGQDGGGGRRTTMNEPEAPPPRLIRSLLDLNI